jgi:hypothetical protein
MTIDQGTRRLKILSINLRNNQSAVKTAGVLTLLTDEQIPFETHFGIVRQRVFQTLNKAAAS